MAGLELLLSVIPLSLGGVLSLLINTILVFLVLILVNKVIEHDMDVKHSIIMAVLALFLAPLAMALITLTGVASIIPFFGLIAMFIVPLLVWIILGEILLHGDRMERLKVTVIAFVVYFLLQLFLVPNLIRILPF